MFGQRSSKSKGYVCVECADSVVSSQSVGAKSSSVGSCIGCGRRQEKKQKEKEVPAVTEVRSDLHSLF